MSDMEKVACDKNDPFQETDKAIYSNLAKNRICTRHDVYYCYLCARVTRLECLSDVLKHIDCDTSHKTRYGIEQVYIEKQMSHISEKQCKEMILNGIIPIVNLSFYCTTCTQMISHFEQISKHITNVHLKKKNQHPLKKNSNIANKNTSVGSSLDIPLTVVYFCNICKKYLKTDASIKYHKMFHLNEENRINGNVDIINFSVQENKEVRINCRICQYVIKNEQMLEDHIMGINHLERLMLLNKPKKIPIFTGFKMFLENNTIFNYKKEIPEMICKYESYCQLCDQVLVGPVSKKLFTKHKTEQKHISKLNSLLKNKTTLKKIDISNNIQSIYKCFACNSVFSSSNKLYSHYFDIYHMNRIQIIDFILQDKSLSFNINKTRSMIYCSKCDVKTFELQSTFNHINGSFHKAPYENNVVLKTVEKISSKNENKIDSLSTNNNNSNASVNQVAINNKNTKIVQKEMNENSSQNVVQFNCFICNVNPHNLKEMAEHFNSKKHEKNQICYMITNNLDSLEKIKFSCLMCHSNFNGNVHFLEHINYTTEGKYNCEKKLAKNHKLSNSQKVNSKATKSTINEMNNLSATENTSIKSICPYLCLICDVKGQNDRTIIEHLKSLRHEKKKFNFIKNQSEDVLKKTKYLCLICDEKFYSDVQFLVHLNDLDHKNMLQKHVNKTESCASRDSSFKSCNSNFSLDNYTNMKLLDSDQMNSVLYDLIDLKIDGKSLSKRKRKGINKLLSNSKPTLTKRFTNLPTFGDSYISMCIEPSDKNIFKINSAKLQKLQLGLSLTFLAGDVRLCIPCESKITNDTFFIYDHLLGEKHIKFLEKMEEREKDFQNFKDQYSDLRLAKLYMVEISDNLVKCCACNIDIQNDDTILNNHIKTHSHCEATQIQKKSEQEIFKKIKSYLTETWYYAERFFCEICKLKFGSEILFAEHLTTATHLEKYRLNTSYNRLQFNLCIICATYWFGKDCGYSNHSDGHFHQYFLKNKSLITYSLTSSVIDILNSYKNTMDSLVQQSNAIDQTIEKDLIKSIEEIARIFYPRADAHLFGSRACCLAHSDSDLDIYIDCNKQYFNILTPDTINKYLSQIQDQFLKYEDIWIIEEVIFKAKIPIIKLIHRSSNLHCDISCSNGLSIEKTALIRLFIKAYPNCQKLILFLKKWLILNRLSGAEGLTSFAILNLVIFYLQTKEILPNVYKVIKQRKTSKIVAGWEVTKAKNIVVDKVDNSVKELLTGFFLYYADFDYTSDVICPLLGKPIKKRLFANFKDLPLEMENYKRFYESKDVDYFRYDSPMCLQDPVDLSQNVTKAITKFQLRSFKRYCQESAEILLELNEGENEE